MASRVIFHLDMDAFFVAVELLRRPWLRGKPVAVGGDPSRRGVVSSASYEARRFGIRSAMPLARARALCPCCVFLPCNFDDYADVSSRLFRLLGRFTPDIEPLSMEEAYLDMSGFRWVHGPPLATAERMHAEIGNRLGLAASIGIASNKLVARIASARAKPNGVLLVLHGREREFLAPLHPRAIPGVGERTAERLRLLGVDTVGELGRLGEKVLVSALGAAGGRLYRAALGEDADPVTPPADPRSVGRETTFPEDLLDRERILGALSRLAEEACRTLRGAGRQARTVALKLRYADFSTVTRSLTLPEPTDLDGEVFAAARELFRKAWTRRLKVRLVGVCLSRLTGCGWQSRLPFGGADRERLERLCAGADRIRDRYGPGSIMRGRSMISR